MDEGGVDQESGAIEDKRADRDRIPGQKTQSQFPFSYTPRRQAITSNRYL